MAGLVIKPRSRIFSGHHWVYQSEIKKHFGDPQPGDVISLKDFKDRFCGSAIYNPQSQIVARRFSWRNQELDEDFFCRRLERALTYRRTLTSTEKFQGRLLWSESDGLPGVVLDYYADIAVLQCLTLAMDQRIDLLVRAIEKILQPRCIIERNDSPMRLAEGLEQRSGVLRGELPPEVAVEINGLHFTLHPLEGQKTGFYWDQVENYSRVAALAAGRRVLDCFSHAGGFALHCARAGAQSVTALDISAEAVAQIEANAQRNQLPLSTVTANAFDYLKQTAQAEEHPFDLIILDPPSFTKSKKNLRDALRGYREIHLRALQILRPGGVLITFSCSHHVSDSLFQENILQASIDARQTLRWLADYRQAPDHPILLSIPESAYLKGYAYEILPSF